LDYKINRKDSNPRRNLGELKIRRLKDDAIPRIFPGLPTYLSSTRPKERSVTSNRESRAQRQAEELEAEGDQFLRSDKITSFEELASHPFSDFPSSWNVITQKKQDHLLFEEISFNEDGVPRFKFSFNVDVQLKVKLFANNLVVPTKKISHIIKTGAIQRISDIWNICAFLNDYAEVSPAGQDIIKDCVSKLEKVLENDDLEEIDSGKLSFLIEQLKLLKGSSPSHRYSTSFLWTAITWQKTSPALYKLLKEDGLFTLPSASYLKQLSNAFSLESGLSKSTVAYLEERIKTISEEEKTVALAIDEVI